MCSIWYDTYIQCSVLNFRKKCLDGLSCLCLTGFPHVEGLLQLGWVLLAAETPEVGLQLPVLLVTSVAYRSGKFLEPRFFWHLTYDVWHITCMHVVSCYMFIYFIMLFHVNYILYAYATGHIYVIWHIFIRLDTCERLQFCGSRSGMNTWNRKIIAPTCAGQ